jgi:serine/threonine-protein kinase PknK
MADSGAGDGGPVVDLGIPGYEGARELARGGFGVVYKARQPMFDRTVAIKVLTGASLDERMKERFERECQAMGALSGHPNIVTIYESGYTTDNRPYMVMELMAKGALSDALARRGSLPWQEAVDVGVKLAGGLEAAHRAGVLHRDLKPENVLISQYNESKLADFGIARVQGGVETRTGVVTASIMHAPPEILTGQRPSVAADVYSLGSTIYTLIAGAPAFFRETDESLIPTYTRISMEAPPDLRARGVPDPVARVLETALAKDPSYRYQTAADFGRALQEAQAACGITATPLVLDTGDDDHVDLSKRSGYPVTGPPGYPAGTPSGGYPVTGQPGYPTGTPSGGYPVTGQPGYPTGTPSGGYPVTGQPGYPTGTPSGGYPVTGQPGYPGAPGGAPPSVTPPPHAPYGQPGPGAPQKKGKGALVAAIVAAVVVVGGIGAALALSGGGDDDETGDTTPESQETTVRTDDTGSDPTDPTEPTTDPTVEGPASPEATLSISHGYIGDLTVAVGVADDEGTVLCEDVVQEADPSVDDEDVDETVTLDRCSEFYPPDADNQWYVAVSDEFYGDVGTIESFSVTGPDGEVYEPADLPVDIPDDYRSGVAVGTDGELVVFGSRVAPPTRPEIAVAVTHDSSTVQVQTAIDVVAADGTPLCSAAGPTLSVDQIFTATRVAADGCEALYPPNPDQVWRVTFSDADADGSVGQVQALRIEGPDGATYDLVDGVPLDVAEDAPASVFFDGSMASVGAAGGTVGPATVAVTYSHPYPADLEMLVGVADGAGTLLCTAELPVNGGSEPVTAQTDTFELTECLDQYPPSQDRIWGLLVGDTLADDEGQLEGVTFTGPDGAVFVPVQSLPITIPDNDVDNPVVVAFRPS